MTQSSHAASTILIVDDEPFNVGLLEQELEALGYRTLAASNGKEALEKIASEHPDLVLLDVTMPVMDGFTACRQLKENDETRLIPVVIMTALDGIEDRIRGIEAGADDFLTRPVNPRELAARIETALRLKHTMDRKLAELRSTKERVEDALRRAALAVSTAESDAVYRELTRYLATTLGVECAFIAMCKTERNDAVRTLAIFSDGSFEENTEYDLVGTACGTVVGQQFRLVPSEVRQIFPEDRMFRRLDIEGYGAYPLVDSSGAPLGLIAVCSRRPLTNPDLVESMLKIFAARAAVEIERSRTEEAQRVSEASYRAIFEAAEDAIFVHDWDTGAIVDVNPKACEAYGYSCEEMKRLSLADLSSGEHPYTLEEAARQIGEAKAGKPVRFEWHRKNKDGSLHWDEVHLKSAVLAGEKRVLAFTREITERKRAEDALRNAALAVSTAEGDAVFQELTRHAAETLEVDLSFIALTVEGDASRLRTVALWMDGRPRKNSEYAVRGTPCEAVIGGEFLYYPRGVRAMFPEDLSWPFNAESYAAFPLTDREGHPLGVIALVDRKPLRDAALVESVLKIFAARAVSEIERWRAAEDLRAREERYRLLFEMESDAILLADVETLQILDANRAATSLYGYGRDELLRLRATDLSFEPEQTATTIQSQAAATMTIPVRLHRKRDGTVFPVEISVNAFELGGRRMQLAAIRDITERKEREEALRASEERYRAIFDAAADAVVLRDADFRIVDVNAAYCAISGYTKEEVVGTQRVVAGPLNPGESLEAMHRRALAGESVHFEAVGVRKDGAQMYIDERLVPVLHEGRRHVLYVGRDITERKRAEAERAKLEAQLLQAQKMEAIGHLTGGIAHDFNNILTSIMGYIVLATEREENLDDPKLGKYLEQAHLASTRARDLIQQMLTFSRGQRGEPRPVSLPPLIKETAKLLRSTLPSTIELETKLEGDAPAVMLDPVQVEQVLLNLCINARDAMGAAGSIRVSVKSGSGFDHTCASCRKPVRGRFVELSVRDTGPGIAPEVAERMFEPFFSTKEVGKSSGMGLSTVHGIVHEHGGHIVVDAAPGKGAEFRVLFAPVPDNPVAIGKVARSRSSRPRTRLTGRVLVVDDEQMVGEFMSDLLEDWGLDVTVKSNPLEARELFLSNPSGFDMVITDQTMPKLTGIELARELLAARPDLPVILYTGYSDTLTPASAEQTGIRAIVKKPVEPAALLAALRAHLPRGLQAASRA